MVKPVHLAKQVVLDTGGFSALPFVDGPIEAFFLQLVGQGDDLELCILW